MRGIQATVVGRVMSVALSGALVLGNLGFSGTAALAEPPVGQVSTASDPAPTVVREIPERRTETSREFLLSNGLVRAQYYSEPVNFRDPTTRQLKPIDSSLEETASSGKAFSVNRANAFSIKLPRDLSRDDVSFEVSGTRVSLRPEWRERAGAARLGDPSSVPARAVTATERAYPDAYSQATLDYESRPDGLKESIVLSAQGNASIFGFAMRLEGLTPRLEADRSITLLSAETSEAILTIPAPFMMDSSGSTIGDDYTNSVHYELSGTGPLYHLDVVADSSWLADPARVYPVRIDPSLLVVSTTLASAQDTFVSSANSNQSYISHPLVWVNNHDPGANWTEYGEIQPSSAQISDMASKKTSGYQVVSSYLKEALGSGNIAYAGSTKGYMCTTSTAWNLTNMTWNTRPSTVTTLATDYVTTVSGWNVFDVTDMTAYWQQAATPYQKATVQLQGAASTHVGYNAADVTSGSKPVWEIDYAQTPTVTLSSPTTGTVTSIPNASWTMTDTGTGFTQAEWVLEVATSETGAAIASTGAANAATSSALPIPSGGFVMGTKYYVRVRAASSPTTQTPRLWSTFDTGNFTPVLPSAVTSPSVSTTASAGWFYESDTNGDGLNDLACNVATQGRGAALLSWPAASGATGYHVYLHDGYTYRQVATTTATSWSTSAKGLYRTDSQIASLSLNTTSNPYLAGTGLDLRDDARPLYARTAGTSLDTTRAFALKISPYNANGEVALSADTTAWARLTNRTVHLSEYPTATVTSPSSGATALVPAVRWNYTSATGHAQVQYRIEVATSTVAPAIATTDVRSAATSVSMPAPAGGFEPCTTYYVRIKVANEPNTGVPLWSSWSPWKDFSIGAPLPVSALSYTTTASANWFAEADTNGDGLNDLKCDAPDYGRGSVTLTWTPSAGATGYLVYLHDGNTYRQVASTVATSWSSAGKGLYPSDSQVASLSAETTSNPYLSESGLDLRDDPRGLYAKTAGSSLDATAGYLFKVVPYNGAGECTSESPEALAVLEGRTTHLSHDPWHSVYELGDMVGNDASARLDAGTLEIDATDLEIASWGPVAALSRHYSSTLTSATLFAPGWRFSFEQSLTQSGTVAVWTDEQGEQRSFAASGGAYTAPVGSYLTLTSDIDRFYVTEKDRTRHTFLRSTGALESLQDANGNVTYFASDANGVTITAANGQTIRLDVAGGKATQATYATSDGTRTILFDAASAVVTYYPDAPAQTYTVSYGYSGSALSTVTAAASGEATPPGPWGFDYASGRLSQVRFPGYVSGNGRRAVLTYGSLSATITRSGEVSGTLSDITQSVLWTPEGRESARSEMRVAGEPSVWGTHRFDVSGNNIFESTSAGAITSRSFDASGNVTLQIDQDGHTSRFAYDALSNQVLSIDERGAETSSTFDAAGNPLAESRQLSATSTALSTWTYDANGRMTGEIRTISATESAATSYSAFAPNGEAQTTVQHGVKLSVDAAPVDLTTTREIDAFGNVVSETDAAGVRTASRAYSETTRLHAVSTTDASNTVTHNAFDAFGRATDSSRSAGSAYCDWRQSVYDAAGNAVLERQMAAAGTIDRTTLHVFDALNREVSTQDSVAGTSSAYFDASGNAVRQWGVAASAQSNEASATRSTFDSSGREILRLDPGARPSEATTLTYDSTGQVVKEQSPSGSDATYVYDQAGEVVARGETLAGGIVATSTIGRDLAGREVTVTDAGGYTTTTTYDAADRPVAVQGTPATQTAVATPTVSVYNTLGWVLSVTEPDGVVTTHEYDRTGREVSSTVKKAGLPDAVTQTTYDGLGHIIRTIKADGTEQVSGFDAFGRSVATTHTRLGQTLKAIRTSYDTLSRVTDSTETVGSVLTHASYANGAAAQTIVESSWRSTNVTRTLSGAGEELSSVANALGIASTRTVSARDDMRRTTAWSVSTTAGAISQSSAFDAAGRLTARSGTGFGAGGVAYSFDADSGRIATESVALGYANASRSYAYGYGSSGTGALRLSEMTATVTSEGGQHYRYTYDTDGSLSAVYPGFEGDWGAEQISSFYSDVFGRVIYAKNISGDGNDSTYSYDSRGRRTQEVRSAYDYPNPYLGTASYSWDDADRLTGWSYSAAQPSLNVTATFGYDASGQRTRSVVATPGGSTETTYTYSGLSLLALETSTSAGIQTMSYLYDENSQTYGLVVKKPGASPVYVGLISNARGDVVELVDGAGTPFATYRYDPWGAPWWGFVIDHAPAIESSGTTLVPSALAADIASSQPLRYAGYAYDQFSGLYYLSARYYDPITCSFISKDPAKADGEKSAYQYCAGDPVGQVDPSGLYAHAFIPDVGDQTNYFLKVLRVNGGRSLMQRYRLGTDWWIWFYQAVKPKGAWDLKRVVPEAHRQAPGFNFLDRWISGEAFGNIHYGYVGHTGGLSLSTLLYGSAAAAFKSDTLQDEYNDSYYIKWGYDLASTYGVIFRKPWEVDRFIFNGKTTARGF